MWSKGEQCFTFPKRKHCLLCVGMETVGPPVQSNSSCVTLTELKKTQTDIWKDAYSLPSSTGRDKEAKLIFLGPLDHPWAASPVKQGYRISLQHSYSIASGLTEGSSTSTSLSLRPHFHPGRIIPSLLRRLRHFRGMHSVIVMHSRRAMNLAPEPTRHRFGHMKALMCSTDVSSKSGTATVAA